MRPPISANTAAVRIASPGGLKTCDGQKARPTTFSSVAPGTAYCECFWRTRMARCTSTPPISSAGSSMTWNTNTADDLRRRELAAEDEEGEVGTDERDGD